MQINATYIAVVNDMRDQLILNSAAADMACMHIRDDCNQLYAPHLHSFRFSADTLCYIYMQVVVNRDACAVRDLRWLLPRMQTYRQVTCTQKL